MRVLEALASFRTLLAVMVAGAVLAAAGALLAGQRADGSYDNTNGRMASLLLAVLFVLWTAARLSYAWFHYRRYEETEDRAAQPQPLPPAFAPRAAELAALGFVPIGERETRLPWQSWRHTWLMASQTEPIVAMVGMPPCPYFTTFWPDGSYLVTIAWNTLGSDVRTAAAWQVMGRGGPAVALVRHRMKAAEFGAGRPYPLVVNSIDAVIEASRLATRSGKVLLGGALRSPAFIASIAVPLALAAWSVFLALVP